MPESPFIVDVTRENYEELIEASFRVPVLLDFWADWCQPCHMLMPVLAKLADEYQGKFLLGKLNTEEHPEIAGLFGIRSLPTVKLFRDGRVVDEFTGVHPEHGIRAFLDRHVARESDTQVGSARELLQAGNAEGAIALLQSAHEADPGNSRVLLALAEAQAAAGDIAAAEATLDDLPADERNKPGVTTLRNHLLFARQVADAPPLADLAKRLEANPADHEARHLLALRKVVEQDYDTAMELLLELMQEDRSFGDDAGRKGLLKVFELLGDDPRVGQYRRRMASLLH